MKKTHLFATMALVALGGFCMLSACESNGASKTADTTVVVDTAKKDTVKADSTKKDSTKKDTVKSK